MAFICTDHKLISKKCSNVVEIQFWMKCLCSQQLLGTTLCAHYTYLVVGIVDHSYMPLARITILRIVQQLEAMNGITSTMCIATLTNRSLHCNYESVAAHHLHTLFVFGVCIGAIFQFYCVKISTHSQQLAMYLAMEVKFIHTCITVYISL